MVVVMVVIIVIVILLFSRRLAAYAIIIFGVDAYGMKTPSKIYNMGPPSLSPPPPTTSESGTFLLSY